MAAEAVEVSVRDSAGEAMTAFYTALLGLLFGFWVGVAAVVSHQQRADRHEEVHYKGWRRK